MTGQHLGEVDLKGARTTFGSSSGLSASVLAGLPAAAVPSHTPGQRRRVPGASDPPRSPQTRASAMDRAAELLFYVNGRKVSAPPRDWAPDPGSRSEGSCRPLGSGHSLLHAGEHWLPQLAVCKRICPSAPTPAPGAGRA